MTSHFAETPPPAQELFVWGHMKATLEVIHWVTTVHAYFLLLTLRCTCVCTRRYIAGFLCALPVVFRGS